MLDETYKDFLPEGTRPHELFGDPDWRGTLVHLYSFSKVFALTGYRVGAITARAQALIEIEKIMDCVAICAPHIGQRAALFGLNHLHDWKREKAEMMAHRTATLRHEFATQQPGWELASSGAYFAYVRHPFSGVPSKQVAMHLAKDHAMLCLPGSVFGPGQDDYLRLAFANVGADRMAEVVQRLAASTETATAFGVLSASAAGAGRAGNACQVVSSGDAGREPGRKPQISSAVKLSTGANQQIGRAHV